MGEPAWEAASPWCLLSAKLQNKAFIMLRFPGHPQTLQDLFELSPSLCPEPCFPRKRCLWWLCGQRRVPQCSRESWEGGQRSGSRGWCSAPPPGTWCSAHPTERYLPAWCIFFSFSFSVFLLLPLLCCLHATSAMLPSRFLDTGRKGRFSYEP